MKRLLPLVTTVALAAGLGACGKAPAPSASGSVAAQQAALEAYTPSLCLEWTLRDGTFTGGCDPTSDIEASYAKGRAQSTADKRFTAIYFDVPQGRASRAVLAGWVEQSQKISDFLNKKFAAGDLVHGSALKFDQRLKIKLEGQRADLATIERGRKDAFSVLDTKVKDYVTQKTGFPQESLNQARRAQAALQPIVDATRVRLDPLVTDLRTKLVAYDTLRKGEPAYRASLESLVKTASDAPYTGLAALGAELTRRQADELTALDALNIDLRESIAPIVVAQEAYEAAVRPYFGFLYTTPGHTELLAAFSAVNESARNALAYLETRRRADVEAGRRLQQSMSLRQSQLLDVATNRTVEETMGPARFNLLAAQFLDDVNARLEALRAPSENSTNLRLPFLLSKVERNYSILDLDPLCAVVPGIESSWRKAGCDAIRSEITKARTQLDLSIPAALRVGVLALQRAGVSAAVTDEILSYLTAKRTREAAMAYDAALRANDAQVATDGGAP